MQENEMEMDRMRNLEREITRLRGRLRKLTADKKDHSQVDCNETYPWFVLYRQYSLRRDW